MTTAIRFVLSVFLAVMVYRETGPWTTVCVCLVMVATEAYRIVMDSVIKDLRQHLEPQPCKPKHPPSAR